MTSKDPDCRPKGDCIYTLKFDDGDPSKRDSWDVYFMNIARQVASRSTCHRKHVGCVIVRDRTILSTGYNGSVRGMPHCDEVGHMMENGHCTRTNHAEANAVAQSAKHGVSLDKGEIYITASPCWTCFKLLANSGIRRIIYGEFYRDDRIFEAAENIGLEICYLDEKNELKVLVKVS
jgi:dCMP deaminase